MKCYNCNKRGHYSAQCPNKSETQEDSFLEVKEESHYAEDISVNSDAKSDDESVLLSFCNHLSATKTYDEGDILLDTGSTVSVFKNTKMLTDIKPSKQTMRALTNGGFQDSNTKGILPGFFPVWVNKDSRLNILAWKDVRERFRITADTSNANEIVVHLNNDKEMVFKEVESGLYLYQLRSV